MYDSDIWDICPVWFVPASFLWVLLDTLWEKIGLLDKLSNRFPKYGKHRIRTWMHRATGIFSYIITIPVVVLVLKLIGRKG